MTGTSLPFCFAFKKSPRKNPNSPTISASSRFCLQKSRNVSFIPSDLIESPTALLLFVDVQQKVWLF